MGSGGVGGGLLLAGEDWGDGEDLLRFAVGGRCVTVGIGVRGQFPRESEEDGVRVGVEWGGCRTSLHLRSNPEPLHLLPNRRARRGLFGSIVAAILCPARFAWRSRRVGGLRFWTSRRWRRCGLIS